MSAEGEADSRGVKIGGQRAAALVAKVVGEARKLAGIVALLVTPL